VAVLAYVSALGDRGEANAIKVKSEADISKHESLVSGSNTKRVGALVLGCAGAGLGIWAWLRWHGGEKRAALGLEPWPHGAGLALGGQF
jgi:hypothetical protein